MAKDAGNSSCNNSTERYYFDSESGRCLVFSYSGCDGNLNNFETLDKCQSQCVQNKILVSQDSNSNNVVNVTSVIKAQGTSVLQTEPLNITTI